MEVSGDEKDLWTNLKILHASYLAQFEDSMPLLLYMKKEGLSRTKKAGEFSRQQVINRQRIREQSKEV
jgi:hypothetical protein